MKNLLKTIFLFVSINAACQQETYYSLYQYNMHVINPAFAGTQDGDLITILNRNQWAGIEGAPKTLSMSYSRPM